MRKNDQNPLFWCYEGVEIELESQDPQKARLEPVLNVRIPNFSFLPHFEGELCEEQTQKMRKMRKSDQKTTFLVL